MEKNKEIYDIPKWCNGKCNYCSEWQIENPHIQVCRGCPYLKEKYRADAIGRFRSYAKKT
jgi:hypothetical protein